MNQTTLFCYTIGLGFAIGFVYDLFRVFRAAFRHPGFLVQIEDVIYWALVSFGAFYFILTVNDGEVRVFNFLGAALGAMLYFGTVSIFFMKVSLIAVRFVKRVVIEMARIVLFPIRLAFNLLSMPVKFAVKTLIKAKKPLKKGLQNSGRYVRIKKAGFAKSLRIIFKKI